VNKKEEAEMSENAQKGYKGLGMEGPIASWYAKNTQKNMEDFIKDAERIVTFVPKEAAILEVAPGPGYLSIELAKLGNYKITGLDINEPPPPTLTLRGGGF
jgi:2-polyprenyl-3-methyl-5-hydroxy-6-metoxy-1,4-benzoquinol methylase